MSVTQNAESKSVFGHKPVLSPLSASAFVSFGHRYNSLLRSWISFSRSQYRIQKKQRWAYYSPHRPVSQQGQICSGFPCSYDARL